jgi:mevalonate pyrophosphate decarboxylase
MVEMVKAVAYPTIPIVFVSSVRDNRWPLHDTMGLAVTDLKEETKVETTVEKTKSGKLDSFTVNGEKLPAERTKSVAEVLNIFQRESGKKFGIKVESNNVKVFSGSSDAGAAALVVAMNELFATNYETKRIAELGMMVSESAIRAVYGGLNIMVVDGIGAPYGKQIASPEDMKDIRIFAMGFNYESRVSAEEIFQLTRSNPFYEYRLKTVPQWIAKIKLGLLNKDWNAVFSVAEENCANAHYLIESSGKRCRRKEMMNAVIDVEEIRASGLPVYWTAGGGKVINAFSWGKDAEKVLAELKKRGQPVIEYKVAPGATIVEKK